MRDAMQTWRSALEAASRSIRGQRNPENLCAKSHTFASGKYAVLFINPDADAHWSNQGRDHMQVGQDIFVLRFEPPADLERLLVDRDCPRTGPAVLLFADSINLDDWRQAPEEPQRALWTEVAMGYHCRVGGRETTAFHYPHLILSRQYGDSAIPVADIHMTRFHPACPDYEGPAAERICEAVATDLAGQSVATLRIRLQSPVDEGPPEGLLRWINRIRYPDVTDPAAPIDAGSQLVWAHEPQITSVWSGDGEANFGAGLGWTGQVSGEAWTFGVVYALRTAEGGSP